MFNIKTVRGVLLISCFGIKAYIIFDFTQAKANQVRTISYSFCHFVVVSKGRV